MTLAVQIEKKLAIQNSWLKDVALIVVGSLLIAASAQVRIYLPGTPVPLTLQTLVVLLIGAAFGAWRGGAAAATYLAAGSLGLPFFAGLKGGALALLGPTGGYLLGFVLAAILVGWLAEQRLDRKWTSALPVFLAGLAVIYLCGTLWLSLFVGGISQALAAGVMPFIFGDLIKISAAGLFLPAAWRLMK